MTFSQLVFENLNLRCASLPSLLPSNINRKKRRREKNYPRMLQQLIETAFPDAENLYSIFGISNTATTNEIKKAYFKMARKVSQSRREFPLANVNLKFMPFKSF
jgi:hypothetical protein